MQKLPEVQDDLSKKSSAAQDNYLAPGEYGEPGKPEGWAILQPKELGGQNIYLTSAKFREGISARYHIAEGNVVDLRTIRESKADPANLRDFTKKLDKIEDNNKDILIHCKKGINRTPVAATIYLMSRGLTRKDAKDYVTEAMGAREDEFVLNQRQHYNKALSEAEAHYKKSDNKAIQPPAEFQPAAVFSQAKESDAGARRSPR